MDVFQVGDTHHLKYMVSMAGPDVFCVSSGKSSQEVLKVYMISDVVCTIP